jgi:hypothetical protein
MKSIRDTLRIIFDLTSVLPVKITIALVGGYAVILHGVERTTLDLDFCVYTDVIKISNTAGFFDVLRRNFPNRYVLELMAGSKIADDPFKHDLIRLTDTRKEILRVDFLIARYKWELEGLQQAEIIKDVPLPVLSKPYLVAMKLQAASYKDAHDIVGLMDLMTEEEKDRTLALAKRIGKDRKLTRLLSPPIEDEVRDIQEEYL